MSKKLEGKVAVVTGASNGIGAEIARHLAAEGASVVVNYASSKAGADKVVADITAKGGKAVAVAGDVSKAAEAHGIIEAALKAYGRLDVLVNNSGVYEFGAIEQIAEEHFHRQFNVNVLGLLLVTQAAVKHLKAGGSVINIGSVVARITRRQAAGEHLEQRASSTSAPWSHASPRRRAPSTPAPRGRWTRSPGCWPRNPGRRASR